MRISVLGAGSWGTTLGIVLYHNGHDVTLWEFRKNIAKSLRKTRINKLLPGVKIPDEIDITSDLDASVKDMHMIIIAVPTQFIREVIRKITSYDFRDTTFVSVAKGIEKETFFTVSQILKDILPDIEEKNIGVLSGPSHAEEVSRKIPTAVVTASNDEDTAREIQSAFNNSYFRVYSSNDLIGVELGGALKNVIAIGAGIIDGAGFGDNTKAAIMTRGIAEISRLGIEMGAKPKTFAGLSGMGDLIVTCMSRHSRNRYVGDQIGQGKKLKEVLKSMDMVAEGVETVKSINALAAKYHVTTPIADAVYDTLFNERDPIKVTYELMTRDTKSEHDE